jgi:hypothetical protein
MTYSRGWTPLWMLRVPCLRLQRARALAQCQHLKQGYRQQLVQLQVSASISLQTQLPADAVALQASNKPGMAWHMAGMECAPMMCVAETSHLDCSHQRHHTVPTILLPISARAHEYSMSPAGTWFLEHLACHMQV